MKYKIIIDVQYGELLDECNRLYDGAGYDPIYSDCNGEAVIDFLREWDDENCTGEVSDIEPRWIDNGTDHVHHKDGYTLIYNSTIGGVYMLYREVREDEI